VLLVVPYSTGAIGYLYENGLFPIQPRNYLVGIVALLFVYALAKRPRVNASIVVLLALITLRIGDLFFFDRVPNLDKYELLSAEGAALAYAFGVIFLCGDRMALRYCALVCGSLTILVCSGVNAWEWQNPGYFSPVEGRSAGMFTNPNDSGTAVGVMLGVVLSMTPPLWLAAALICSSGIGVYFTLSRGGAIVWLLVIVAYLVIVGQKRLRRMVGLAVWLGLIILLIVKLVDFENALSGGGTTAVSSNVSGREKVFFGQEELDANDTGRVDVLREGVQGIQEQPIVGYGTGASLGELYSPHNEFVAVWLDNGLVGMALYSLGLCLLVGSCILKNKALLIGCVPLVAEIAFSHNLLEHKSYLFAWIVLAGMVQFARETESPVVSDGDVQEVCDSDQDAELLEVS
jgi:hypothetical protein